MRGEWLWTPTPAFLSMLRALPRKEEHQVLEKLKILELDPSPDGKAKKSDVHESLKFQGRTSVLRTVYRSTYEIGQATQSYLSTGILDDEPVEYKYMHNGPLPVVREVIGDEEEVQLLIQFMHGAAHDLRFSLGSCAVLCPTNDSGRALATSLKRGGIEATFMESKDLDLSWRGVKVLTLNSAKGLEFPIVGLAGFAGSRYALATPETEKEEALARMRRTLFVGMTRAMRALLVIVPAGTASPLLTGFDARYWHIKNAAASSIIAGGV